MTDASSFASPSAPSSALPDRLIGISLKMYMSHAQTVDWAHRVTELTYAHPAIASGTAGLVLLPQFPSIPACLDVPGPLQIGAQNLSAEDAGAWTGEVSGAVLAEIGCRFVEVGHAERRRHFHETDDIVRAKTAAALRHGLFPILCVGESAAGSPESAAAEVVTQIRSALPATAGDLPPEGGVVIAYEPIWAIGAQQPAAPDHIIAVCEAVRARTRIHFPSLDFRLIYGGSAGPGLLTRLGPTVDGLFLGRFAHDPDSVPRILDELADVIMLKS
ncbi:triose-phosphate isomerase family protein [Brevibacterium sp. ZH18]|uniref:triose-phosphate isomerase family protein n=1 Tax=Brevibacterium sp. ZH18 TaxID=2927784 RepID=UPI001F611CEB|nr:triose-phosphate isomerase family protein [Brevibacterium sp. ZH18]MCI4012634.1 triose-phosphate isomerase [Brevibacterium sp. ZH18]